MSQQQEQEQEATPLLSGNGGASGVGVGDGGALPSSSSFSTSSSSYYFVGKNERSYQGIGISSTIRDNDGDPIVEEIPVGSTMDDFVPRIINDNDAAVPKRQLRNSNSTTRGRPSSTAGVAEAEANIRSSSSSSSSWSLSNTLLSLWWWRGGVDEQQQQQQQSDHGQQRLVRLRKAPVKVEPKVFFANERTFLAWMHLSVILAGASIAILAFADNNNNNSSSPQAYYPYDIQDNNNNDDDDDDKRRYYRRHYYHRILKHSNDDDDDKNKDDDDDDDDKNNDDDDNLSSSNSDYSMYYSNYNPYGQLYGIILLPVAISFILYSLYQYHRRSYMIRTKHPGPYEDTIGPIVLCIMLILSIIIQFILKLVTIMYH